MFRGEFIFPQEGLIANLERTLNGLEKDNVIRITRDAEGTPIAVGLSDAERQCGRENYDFYCFLIWPFIEASWLGAVSLMGLTPPSRESADVWIDLNKAQDSAQLVGSFPAYLGVMYSFTDERKQLGKTLYHQGDLSYFEAVNKETLKNAYQRFAEEGIILVARSKDKRTPPTMKLAPEWTPERDPVTNRLLDRGRLWDFTERIAKSRREGYVTLLQVDIEFSVLTNLVISKNRRDGATVSSRVLTMTDTVGRALFESATRSDTADMDVTTRKQRRTAIAERANL